jgi:PadR family transcriptional regulator PadR
MHSRERSSVAESTSDWTSQLRRGVLELCILQVLRRDASYGYEIVTTLGSLGPLAAGENTVYPLLRRLKTEGVLETFTEDSPAGPPRQYYRLSPEGRRRLTALQKEWEAMADAVARCMNLKKEDPS